MHLDPLSAIVIQVGVAIWALTELFKQARLASRDTSLGMVHDPSIAPLLRRRDAPALRVEMVSAEVDLRNSAVVGEVVASSTGGVRVGAVIAGGQTETLLTGGDHTVRVDALDVLGSVRDPGGHNAQVAAGAARLVGQLPAEDRRAGWVAGDDGLDVCLVLSLSLRVVVPLGVVCDAGVGEVGCHPTIVGPVVHEVNAGTKSALRS